MSCEYKYTNKKEFNCASFTMFAFKFMMASIVLMIIFSVYFVFSYPSVDDEENLDMHNNSNKCSQLKIISRAQWNATNAINQSFVDQPFKHVFIHHTAMNKCIRRSNCQQEMRLIQYLHMDENGFNDIGYSWCVGGDGKIYEGRGWYLEGAHTLGYNRDGIGICVFGNFELKSPTKRSLNAVQKLIDCGVISGHIRSDYELHGHLDARCTKCPGKNLYSVIKKWKRFVGGKLERYSCGNANSNNIPDT